MEEVAYTDMGHKLGSYLEDRKDIVQEKLYGIKPRDAEM